MDYHARIEAGSNEAAVVRSIVLLGSSLGKTVVAEGIETEAQLKQLQEMGCGLGQGYLLAYPKSPADITTLLNSLLPEVPLTGPTWSATQHGLTVH